MPMQKVRMKCVFFWAGGSPYSDNPEWESIYTGWWFGTFFIVLYYNGVILPIDELHHFSRWLLHHQPGNQYIYIWDNYMAYVP